MSRVHLKFFYIDAFDVTTQCYICSLRGTMYNSSIKSSKSSGRYIHIQVLHYVVHGWQFPPPLQQVVSTQQLVQRLDSAYGAGPKYSIQSISRDPSDSLPKIGDLQVPRTQISNKQQRAYVWIVCGLRIVDQIVDLPTSLNYISRPPAIDVTVLVVEPSQMNS